MSIPCAGLKVTVMTEAQARKHLLRGLRLVFMRFSPVRVIVTAGGEHYAAFRSEEEFAAWLGNEFVADYPTPNDAEPVTAGTIRRRPAWPPRPTAELRPV